MRNSRQAQPSHVLFSRSCKPRNFQSMAASKSPKKIYKGTHPAEAHARKIGRIARERLGFDELRPGQQEAIESILDRCDTLVVQPTGSGKSAIYQIAGLLLSGPT